MAKLGIQKPNKSQVVNAGATTVGAVAGYQGYEMAAQRLPITKEINLGILGASIIGQAALKGSGIVKTFASALLIGVTINAGFTAAEDYGLLDKLNKVSPVIASADELKGLYGYDDVEYIQDAQIVENKPFQLAGAWQPNYDLM